VRPTELLSLLQEFYSERAALMMRHVAVARHVGNLDFNNTYQYLIAREETHLSWIRSAIEELGGVAAPPGAEPAIQPSKGADFVHGLIDEDARSAQAFTAEWTDRVEQVTNARHRLMLRVVLGETLEHQRFFEQAGAGREDLLGRRLDAGPRRGEVVGARWQGD
jgi:Mn-containing catalase